MNLFKGKDAKGHGSNKKGAGNLQHLIAERSKHLWVFNHPDAKLIDHKGAERTVRDLHGEHMQATGNAEMARLQIAQQLRDGGYKYHPDTVALKKGVEPIKLGDALEKSETSSNSLLDALEPKHGASLGGVLGISKAKDSKGHGSEKGRHKNAFAKPAGVPYTATVWGPRGKTITTVPGITHAMLNGEHVGTVTERPHGFFAEHSSGADLGSHKTEDAALQAIGDHHHAMVGKILAEAGARGTSHDKATGHVDAHIREQNIDAGTQSHVAPHHVVEEDGMTHEYYPDHYGGFGARHIRHDTGEALHTHHGADDVRGSASKAHEEYKNRPEKHDYAHKDTWEGRGKSKSHEKGTAFVDAHKKQQPHPGRDYWQEHDDKRGFDVHTYYPAKDRGGFYGKHMTASSGYTVSHHPRAKSHDEAHMEHMKARGVVKSEDGGSDANGPFSLTKSKDARGHGSEKRGAGAINVKHPTNEFDHSYALHHLRDREGKAEYAVKHHSGQILGHVHSAGNVHAAMFDGKKVGEYDDQQRAAREVIAHAIGRSKIKGLSLTKVADAEGGYGFSSEPIE